MPNIIIEGPDNAGKSHLVKAIADHYGWPVQISGGREKWPNEINQRVRRYLGFTSHIFDRHPAISQEIYRRVHHGTPIQLDLLKTFYKQGNLIIYCRPDMTEGLTGQIIKDYDKPEHIKQIKENFTRLVEGYDFWAVQQAHIIRRKYNDIGLTLRLIAGSCIS